MQNDENAYQRICSKADDSRVEQSDTRNRNKVLTSNEREYKNLKK